MSDMVAATVSVYVGLLPGQLSINLQIFTIFDFFSKL